MPATRAALFLDFDNVFGGLLSLDPTAAIEWAANPTRWLAELERTSTGETRRWLVLKCYMNPDGRVVDPRERNRRIQFSQFRRGFTDAGFEFVDCPRLNTTKNAADIRLVVDALDALHGPHQYDEFVVASGDSDMTPLLVRLRSADRRTTVMSSSESAALVLAAVADEVIDGPTIVELVDQRTLDEPPVAGTVVEPEADVAQVVDDGAPAADSLPEAIVRVSTLFGLPRLPARSWPVIAHALAQHIDEHGFQLTDATRAVRDDLAVRGESINRRAVNVVVSGSTHGGVPLYREPAPQGREILSAFAANVIARASASETEFTAEELAEIGKWFGLTVV